MLGKQRGVLYVYKRENHKSYSKTEVSTLGGDLAWRRGSLRLGALFVRVGELLAQRHQAELQNMAGVGGRGPELVVRAVQTIQHAQHAVALVKPAGGRHGSYIADVHITRERLPSQIIRSLYTRELVIFLT